MSKTKAERQAETAAMPKCSCGNVVSFGKNMCGRCFVRSEAAIEEDRVWDDRIRQIVREEIEPRLKNFGVGQ